MKKVNKNNKKKLLAASGGLAALALLAGTFAWFTSEDQKTNHFEGKISGNDVEIVEVFDPKPWEPGEEINKDVTILNSGEYDSFIRVSLQETIQLLSNSSFQQSADGTGINGKTAEEVYLDPATAPAGYTPSTWEGTAPSVTLTGAYEGTYTLAVFEKASTDNGKTTYGYRYLWTDGTNYYTAKGVDGFTRNETTGSISITSGTPTVLYLDLAYDPARSMDWTAPVYAPAELSPLPTGTSWTVPAYVDAKVKITFSNLTSTPSEADKWYYNAADGYFYYTSIVAPEQQTARLIDAVSLSGDAGNEYSKMLYDLIVNANGISAFKESVNSGDWVNGTDNTLATALEAIAPAK